MTTETDRPTRQGRSLLANSALLSTTAVAVSAANYLLNVALARMLPPDEFGDVSLVVTWSLPVHLLLRPCNSWHHGRPLPPRPRATGSASCWCGRHSPSAR